MNIKPGTNIKKKKKKKKKGRMDPTSQCYQQAWREVCADMSAARAMNEDNKPDNRERDTAMLCLKALS